MRADRLISIMMNLQNKGRMTAKELSQLLEVSESTIYRDIDALSSAGVPIQADSGIGGGFTLPPDYRTKVDGLNTAEIQALFLQMNEQPLKQLGINQPLKSALLKIFSTLSEQHRLDAEWIRNRVFLDMESWRQPKEQSELMQAVQRSVREQRTARLMYTDRFNRKHELELEPLGLVLKAGMWFVIGNAGGKMKALRIAKIECFQLLEKKFDLPDPFSLEASWREWMRSYEKREFPYKVILKTNAGALSRISGMNGCIHESAVFEKGNPEDPGWTEVHISFETKEAALSAVLSQGSRVQVAAPRELRERIHEQAARLMDYYSTDKQNK